MKETRNSRNGMGLSDHPPVSRDVLGTILVGGFSRRMGAPKAAMRVQGRSVLSCLAELLASRLGEVWAIGSPQIGRPDS